MSGDGLASSMETLKRKLDSLATRRSEILQRLRQEAAPEDLSLRLRRTMMADHWMRLAARIRVEIHDTEHRLLSSSDGLLSLSRVLLAHTLRELTKRVDQLLDFSASPDRLAIVGFEGLGGYGSKLSFSMNRMRSRLEEVICIAADITVELEHKERALFKTRTKEVDSWLEQVERTRHAVYDIEWDVAIGSWSWSRALASRVDCQTTELDRLIRQSGRFGELTLDVGNKRFKPCSCKPLGESFQRSFNKIWDCLTNNQGMRCVGIYGPGGVGKTYLATHIHNELLSHNFDDVCWVKVGVSKQRIGIGVHELQKRLANVFGLDLSKTEDEQIRAERLSELLSEKDVVIVLDDVRECYDLDKVGIPLSRCKVIVTSRSLDVCRGMQCDESIGVDPLSEEESWDFFKQITRSMGWRDLLSKLAGTAQPLPTDGYDV